MVCENLQSFERKKDPISSLDIGQRKIIKDWLDEKKIENYIINEDNTIDIYNTRVDLSYEDLKILPEYIKFNRVNGHFHIDHNRLESLKGCPRIIDGDFLCDNNQLASLEYCPEFVGRDFSCYDNLVKFKEYDIRKICELHSRSEIYVTNPYE